MTSSGRRGIKREGDDDNGINPGFCLPDKKTQLSLSPGDLDWELWFQFQGHQIGIPFHEFRYSNKLHWKVLEFPDSLRSQQIGQRTHNQ